LKNTLSKSKTHRKLRKSVKFIAKDPLQSHNFNNNQGKLDAGIEQFGLYTAYPLSRVWAVLGRVEVNVKIIESCGVDYIDVAGVETFKKAETVPSPPDSLIKDGKADLKWDFIVKP
jgi:hypothetical protein